MSEFKEEAARLRKNLEVVIEIFELPTFEVFLSAGCNSIHQIYEMGLTRENATFADHISSTSLYVPKDVIKAMCIGASYIEAALSAHEKGYPFALRFLIGAAEEDGFLRGAAFGTVHEDERSRAALSVNGKKGAASLHGPRTELKLWALLEASKSRNSDKDTARMLAVRIPAHLAGASKDPERLIYDALRATAKPN